MYIFYNATHTVRELLVLHVLLTGDSGDPMLGLAFGVTVGDILGEA